jgi:cytochrome c oxidase assembly protein subunit 15
VQFNHRMTAYLLLAVAALHVVDVARNAPRALPLAAALLGAIMLQAALGVFTLLQQVPISLALMHQTGAIVVLALATAAAQRISVKRSSIPSGLSGTAR